MANKLNKYYLNHLTRYLIKLKVLGIGLKFLGYSYPLKAGFNILKLSVDSDRTTCMNFLQLHYSK